MNKLFNIIFASVLFLCTVAMAFGQNLSTDKADYAPGSTAILLGSGFAPGESVTLQVLHADGTTTNGGAEHDPWNVVADGTGGLVTTWHVCEDDCVGKTLIATANGASAHAEVTFTDGNAPGKLCAPLPEYNPTHYALLVGTCVTATIEGATDVSNYAVNGTVTVFIKHSNLGINEEVVGTVSGTTITFTYCSTVQTGCLTSNVAYGDVGNTATNTCYNSKGNSAAGFAFVDANGNNVETCEGTPPPPLGCSVTPGSSQICAGSSATFTVTATGGVPPYSYLWSTGGTGTSITVSAAGSYSVVVKDAAGNTTTCAATLTVCDIPALSGCPDPDGGTFQCLSDVPPSAASVTASDCNGAVTVTFSETESNPGSSCNNTITRKWSATNQCGTSTCTQTIHVNDTEAPVLTGCPNPDGGTFQCLSDVPAPPTVTANDNCSGATAVTYNETQSNPGSSCNNTITRTWSTVDACGNPSSCSQTIHVNDTTPPSLSDKPADASYQCAGEVPPPPPVSANDNCNGQVPVGYIESSSGSGCLNDPLVITRTWSASDACGNPTSYTQTIKVADTTPPVLSATPGNASFQCYGDVPPPPPVGAVDNCDGVIAVDYTSSESNPGSSCNNTITRTWTAKDKCGNTVSATQTIEVNDTQGPSFSGPWSPIVANVDGDNCCKSVGYENPKATDNCDQSPEVTCEPPSGFCFPVGTTTVVCHAKDACGNLGTNVASFDVTVLSSICATVFYDANGNGVQDNGEIGVGGITVTLTPGGSQVTGGDGSYCFTGLPAGSYTVSVALPTPGSNCKSVATTAKTVTVGLTCPAKVKFGYQCVCTPGGLTIGFWSNKNGGALITAADLSALRGFCLRSGDGSNFDPNTVSQYQSWLLKASATNMAYMLSAQMSGTYLNVQHGKTNASILIDGTRNVNDEIAYANSLLCANPVAIASGAIRTEMERVKNIFDKLNNGGSFIQPGPCGSGGGVQFFEGSVEPEQVGVSPTEFALLGSYPNPFNPTTTISYQLAGDVQVSLRVFDMLGREVATLVNTSQGAGQYNVQFDGSKLSSGIYIYRLQAGTFTATSKLLLAK